MYVIIECFMCYVEAQKRETQREREKERVLCEISTNVQGER